MKRCEVVTVVVLAAAFAGARLAGEKHPAFQAAAHLFVGGLIIAAYFRWAGVWWKPWTWPLTGLVAIVLSLIELAAFLFLPR